MFIVRKLNDKAKFHPPLKVENTFYKITLSYTQMQLLEFFIYGTYTNANTKLAKIFNIYICKQTKN